jgi:ribosomal protein S27AE
MALVTKIRRKKGENVKIEERVCDRCGKSFLARLKDPLTSIEYDVCNSCGYRLSKFGYVTLDGSDFLPPTAADRCKERRRGRRCHLNRQHAGEHDFRSRRA